MIRNVGAVSSLRRTPGLPAPDLARSLGTLLVMTGRLAKTTAAVELHVVDAEATPPWLVQARKFLDLAAALEEAAAEKSFTGSSGEHLAIEGEGGIRIPADAGYITVLAQRMERHARLGRLLAPEPELTTVAPAAELVG